MDGVWNLLFYQKSKKLKIFMITKLNEWWPRLFQHCFKLNRLAPDRRVKTNWQAIISCKFVWRGDRGTQLLHGEFSSLSFI
ncbi:MAG TPA: hypothetical protein DCM19_07170 [Parasutterella excrementihominis]|nr:hypothetical protein [Parasutterella excrementihominis]HBZ28021.1 hypothetical protein [Parasutterella excrementihominis]